MGSRGPQPTPTAILKARGSWLVRGRKDEPEPELGRPRCPSWLTAEAKRKWKRLVPKLEAMRVLAEVDEDLVMRYCLLVVEWKHAILNVQEHGISEQTDKGSRMRPEVVYANTLMLELRQLETLLGMSPSARSRIRMEPKADASSEGIERFFVTKGAG